MCSNTFSWIFGNFSFFDIFSTSNQKFINIFATSLLSSGSKNLVNAFGSRSKKYRKTKNYQKSMKMCSNTYLMPMLSNFGLLTPLLAGLGTVNVQNPLILADFGRSYAFTSEAFMCRTGSTPLIIVTIMSCLLLSFQVPFNRVINIIIII